MHGLCTYVGLCLCFINCLSYSTDIYSMEQCHYHLDCCVYYYLQYRTWCKSVHSLVKTKKTYWLNDRHVGRGRFYMCIWIELYDYNCSCYQVLKSPSEVCSFLFLLPLAWARASACRAGRALFPVWPEQGAIYLPTPLWYALGLAWSPCDTYTCHVYITTT